MDAYNQRMEGKEGDSVGLVRGDKVQEKGIIPQ